MVQNNCFKIYVLLGVGLFAAFFASLSLGKAPISVVNGVSDLLQGKESYEGTILLHIRLPRTLLGVIAGATLGLAGASMQGFLRNPLAEPGVLGITGGAVLGAVLMLYTGLSMAFPLALPLGGMVGALVVVLVLYLFAGSLTSITTLILAGVALNTLAFSGTSLALNLSSNPYAALEIVFWQMGSLVDKSFQHVGLVLPFTILGCLLLLWDNRSLDALSLGEEAAQSLGVSMKGLRWRLVLGTAFAVGAVVSVCGSIGFVGLVVPHLMRPLVGHQPSKLMGLSALGGAVLILLADIAVRLIPSYNELKLGVLISLLGAPFFVFLIFKLRKESV